MLHAKTCQTNGHQRIVSTQIARYPHTYIHAWYLVENKEVPDRNIGVPPVRKYAIYLRAEINMVV
jgi:hypothetical protein